MWWALCVIAIVAGDEVLPTQENVTSRNVYSTFKNIIAEGYHAETHNVITEDEYILEVYRIPYRRNEDSGDENRPIVLLMHGLLGASNSFTIYGSEYSMGYHLADAGYDVWLGNARGTKNSRRHLKLDADDNTQKLQFFDFTFEDIGRYDVAAMVNYILNHTKQDGLHFIGHSQGATNFLVLASMRPEFNRKFISAHLLGPVGYQNHFPNQQLLKISRITDMLYSVGVSLGYVELYPPNSTVALDINTTSLCLNYLHSQNLCESLNDKIELTTSEVDVDLIGGGSIKQFAHYGQNIRDRAFRRWNYGIARNLQIYGWERPPPYDLKKITTKVTLHYTLNDKLVDVRDILAMAHDLRHADIRKVPRDSFLHEEFVTAKDAKELVTVYIIDAIAKDHQNKMEDDSYEVSEEDDEDYEEESPSSSRNVESQWIKLFITFSFFVFCNL
ncbi:Lipase 3 [Papilio machaon]|uniref:Lipase 3 n=1 Tax=Papilio machaon TaxID=76193 RepID=A0A194QWT8_PAPMA|nr:Lipase 3 [Papilio machaon]